MSIIGNILYEPEHLEVIRMIYKVMDIDGDCKCGAAEIQRAYRDVLGPDYEITIEKA